MTASSPVDVTGLVQGLAALTQTTDLQGRSVEYIKSQENTSYGASPSYVYLFRYDPATGTYTIDTSSNSVVRSYWPSFLTVRATDRSPSQSTAAFDVYKGAEYTTRVLRTGAGNPDIALTYTSFADLTRNDTQPFIVGQAHQYIMFGTRTPAVVCQPPARRHTTGSPMAAAMMARADMTPALRAAARSRRTSIQEAWR
jgi:hypothetical protein